MKHVAFRRAHVSQVVAHREAGGIVIPGDTADIQYVHISQVVTHRDAEGIGIPGDTADIRLVSGDTSKIHFQEILQR